MLIPFGILSSAGGVGVVGDYELIATEILTANTPSVTFSSLATYASTYKHLQIRVVAKTDRTDVASDFLNLRFNGDSGSNYALHNLRGDDVAVNTGATTSSTSLQINRFGGNATAGYFGAAVVDILDAYSTSKNKTIRSLGGASGGFPFVWFQSGVFLSTSSTTSLTITPGGGTNILAGSRFSLYGIRGEPIA